MAIGVVKAIYRFKYLIFYQLKNTGKMTRAQGKRREKTGNLVLIRAWQPCLNLGQSSQYNVYLFSSFTFRQVPLQSVSSIYPASL